MRGENLFSIKKKEGKGGGIFLQLVYRSLVCAQSMQWLLHLDLGGIV